MKKLLVGLILVASSALSFGAQRVPYEKLSFPGGYISYNDEKFTGEFERKDPRTGKINMVGLLKMENYMEQVIVMMKMEN